MLNLKKYKTWAVVSMAAVLLLLAGCASNSVDASGSLSELAVSSLVASELPLPAAHDQSQERRLIINVTGAMAIISGCDSYSFDFNSDIYAITHTVNGSTTEISVDTRISNLTYTQAVYIRIPDKYYNSITLNTAGAVLHVRDLDAHITGVLEVSSADIRLPGGFTKTINLSFIEATTASISLNGNTDFTFRLNEMANSSIQMPAGWPQIRRDTQMPYHFVSGNGAAEIVVDMAGGSSVLILEGSCPASVLPPTPDTPFADAVFEALTDFTTASNLFLTAYLPRVFVGVEEFGITFSGNIEDNIADGRWNGSIYYQGQLIGALRNDLRPFGGNNWGIESRGMTSAGRPHTRAYVLHDANGNIAGINAVHMVWNENNELISRQWSELPRSVPFSVASTFADVENFFGISFNGSLHDWDAVISGGADIEVGNIYFHGQLVGSLIDDNFRRMGGRSVQIGSGTPGGILSIHVLRDNNFNVTGLNVESNSQAAVTTQNMTSNNAVPQPDAEAYTETAGDWIDRALERNRAWAEEQVAASGNRPDRRKWADDWMAGRYSWAEEMREIRNIYGTYEQFFAGIEAFGITFSSDDFIVNMDRYRDGRGNIYYHGRLVSSLICENFRDARGNLLRLSTMSEAVSAGNRGAISLHVYILRDENGNITGLDAVEFKR